MQSHRQNRRIPLVRLVAVIFCCACASFGASAVLSGLELAGSSRGLALTLKADAPFTLKTDQKVSAKDPGLSLLAIHCTGVIYGLEDFEFTEFPPACPLRRISVSESPADNSIDLLFAFTKGIDNPVPAKQKGNRWIVLLSRAPADDFAWNTQPQKPLPAAQKQKTAQEHAGMSRLTDITLLHRDRVELLTFVFDGPTAMRLKRGQERIVVLFVNATSGLSSTRFSPPGAPHTVIELKQVTHGGTLWLGATVTMRKDALDGALMQAFSDKLVIYSPSDTQQGLSLWSAAQGTSMAYPFIKIPRFEVDYDSMKRKALTDLSGDLAMGRTFAVREEAQKKAGQGLPAAETVSRVPEKEAAAPATHAPAPSVKREPAPVRLLVTKNNVNLRSEPVAGDNVMAKLPLGTVATQIEKKGTWVKIRTLETTGWVSSAMTVDSARAPQAVVSAIEQFNQQRVAQQKAAEEKAARESAAKEKAQQEKLAKEKLAQERESQKKAALEALSAKQDSSVRYTAAVQESAQTIINLGAKKLVEYHIYGRDPFLPLSSDNESRVPDVQNLKLVGILYDEADRLALFEDFKGKAYVMRENDPVQNGYVLRVQPDKVLFLINDLGISRTYALKLNKDKEKVQ